MSSPSLHRPRLPGLRAAPALWLGLLAFWTGIGVLYGVQIRIARGQGTIPWGPSMLSGFQDAYTWMVVCVAAFAVAFRVPARRGNLGRIVAAAVALTLLRSAATALAALELETWRLPLWAYVRLFPGQVLSVVAYLAAGYALESWWRYRERERINAGLRGRLASADLQALTLFLRPQFVLDTFGAIAARMRRDADAADRMLSRLGDLLRLILTRSGDQVATVDEELALVRSSLQFGLEEDPGTPRLRIVADDEAGRLPMPRLILHSLVELAGGDQGPLPPGTEMEIAVRRAGPGLAVRIHRVGTPAIGHRRESGRLLESVHGRLTSVYGGGYRLRIRRPRRRRVVVELLVRGLRDASPPDAPTLAPLAEPAPDPAAIAAADPADGAEAARRLPGWRLFGAFWIVLTGLNVAAFAASLHLAGARPVPLRPLAVPAVSMGSLIALAAVAVAVARRFPARREGWRLPLAINLASTVALLFAFALARHVAGHWSGADTSDFVTAFWFAAPGGANILVGIAALGQAGFLLREIRQEEVRSLELSAQLGEAQLRVLKMQLHPHFLFNALNSISALMHRDVDAGARMLGQLGMLLELSLHRTGTHLVTLDEELRYLRLYLGIEQARFRDRLRVRIEVEPGVGDALVPHLILQPLVENAIRHGIAPSHLPATLVISARRGDDGALDVRVADTGVGLRAGWTGEGTGLGLANTRARLRRLYGDRHALRVGPNGARGVEVRMRVPAAVRAG